MAAGATKPARHLLYLKKNFELQTKPWVHLNEFALDRTLKNVPEHYKRFYWLWKYAPKAPVHYEPPTEKFEKLDHGQVVPVPHIPVPLLMPEEFQHMLTGGEGVIKGYSKKDKRFDRRIPRYWIPKVNTCVVYSEILDERLEVLATRKALELIDAAYGLDNYILKTPVPDLSTELAMKIRRRLLYSLTDKTLHPNDEKRRDELHERYTDYLIPREELEWFGLNIYEARLKQTLLEEEASAQIPLKSLFREQLLEYLKAEQQKELEESKDEKVPNRSELSRLIGQFQGLTRK